jgi:hypothetical protein
MAISSLPAKDVWVYASSIKKSTGKRNKNIYLIRPNLNIVLLT